MKIASLLVVVLLAGCASQTIEPSYYLIRPTLDMESRQLKPSREFSMGSVVIAPYMDQQGLLLETREGELRAARHHLWAEPLYDGVRNQLQVEIGEATGEDLLPASMQDTSIVLDIRIDQLHGTNRGTAKLVAYWWLRRDREIVSLYRFAEEQALAADGFAELVAAEKALLRQLATKIAATLVVPES